MINRTQPLYCLDVHSEDPVGVLIDSDGSMAITCLESSFIKKELGLRRYSGHLACSQAQFADHGRKLVSIGRGRTMLQWRYRNTAAAAAAAASSKRLTVLSDTRRVPRALEKLRSQEEKKAFTRATNVEALKRAIRAKPEAFAKRALEELQKIGKKSTDAQLSAEDCRECLQSMWTWMLDNWKGDRWKCLSRQICPQTSSELTESFNLETGRSVSGSTWEEFCTFSMTHLVALNWMTHIGFPLEDSSTLHTIRSAHLGVVLSDVTKKNNLSQLKDYAVAEEYYKDPEDTRWRMEIEDKQLIPLQRLDQKPQQHHGGGGKSRKGNGSAQRKFEPGKPEETDEKETASRVSSVSVPCSEVLDPTTPTESQLQSFDKRMPNQQLKPAWVYGYNLSASTNNILYDGCGHLVYPAACFAIVFNPATHSQRYHNSNGGQILSLARNPVDPQVIAIAEAATVTNGVKSMLPQVSVFHSLSFVSFRIPNVMKHAVVSVSFSCDGKFLATAQADSATLAVWDWRTGKNMATETAPRGKIVQIKWSNVDVGSLISVGRCHAYFWTWESQPGNCSLRCTEALTKKNGKRNTTFSLQTFCSVAHFPAGKVAVGASGDGQVHIFDASSKALVESKIIYRTSSLSCICDWDSTMKIKGGIIAASDQGHITGINENFEKAFFLQFKGEAIHAITVFNNRLAVGTRAGKIYEVNHFCSSKHGAAAATAAAKKRLVVVGHSKGELQACAMDPKNPKRVLTAAEDGKIIAWNLEQHSHVSIHDVAPPSDKSQGGQEALSLAISADGAYLVVGVVSGSLHIYDAVTMSHLTSREIASYSLERIVKLGASVGIRALKYSPDSRVLAAAGDGMVVVLLDATRDHLVSCVLSAHTAPIQALDWSADGILLRSVCKEGVLHYWDVDTTSRKTHRSKLHLPRSSPVIQDASWQTSNCTAGWEVRGTIHTSTGLNAVDLMRKRGGGGGGILITGDDFGLVSLFRWPCASSHHGQRAFHAHSHPCLGVKFGLDGNTAISLGGRDKAIVQWDLFDDTLCHQYGKSTGDDDDDDDDTPLPAYIDAPKQKKQEGRKSSDFDMILDRLDNLLDSKQFRIITRKCFVDLVIADTGNPQGQHLSRRQLIVITCRLWEWVQRKLKIQGNLDERSITTTDRNAVVKMLVQRYVAGGGDSEKSSDKNERKHRKGNSKVVNMRGKELPEAILSNLSERQFLIASRRLIRDIFSEMFEERGCRDGLGPERRINPVVLKNVLPDAKAVEKLRLECGVTLMRPRDVVNIPRYTAGLSLDLPIPLQHQQPIGSRRKNTIRNLFPKEAATLERPQEGGKSKEAAARETFSSNSKSIGKYMKRILVHGEAIQPWRRVVHLLKPSSNPKRNVTRMPEKKLEIDWVHGYNPVDSRSNVVLNSAGEVVYPCASLIVVYDPKEHSQRILRGHTSDVRCLAQNPADCDIIASGQAGFISSDGTVAPPMICLFNTRNPKQKWVIREAHFRAVRAMAFNANGKILASVGEDPEATLKLWAVKQSKWVFETTHTSKDCGIDLQFFVLLL
eukprot:jgi/Bigna1/137552/aug1.40_g12260